ncbi:MAG TPA: hypothetical protein PK160_01910 [Bacillota bacterium]|nr:hypothetical protein [Bacillota bacterium]
MLFLELSIYASTILGSVGSQNLFVPLIKRLKPEGHPVERPVISILPIA